MSLNSKYYDDTGSFDSSSIECGLKRKQDEKEELTRLRDENAELRAANEHLLKWESELLVESKKQSIELRADLEACKTKRNQYGKDAQLTDVYRKMADKLRAENEALKKEIQELKNC